MALGASRWRRRLAEGAEQLEARLADLATVLVERHLAPFLSSCRPDPHPIGLIGTKEVSGHAPLWR
jgi:hypothetical protein